jgi:hypothetical protein
MPLNTVAQLGSYESREETGQDVRHSAVVLRPTSATHARRGLSVAPADLQTVQFRALALDPAGPPRLP